MAHPGAFCVYTTIAVDLLGPLARLNQGIFGNSNQGDQWFPSPQDFVDRPLSSLIHYHRSQPGSFNKRYFVVIDRIDWQNEGVLGVNLSCEGFIDAARLKPNVAGSAIPSVSIGNTDWNEAILDVVKRPHFAVYAVAEFGDGEKPAKFLEGLNFGLESRKDTAPPTCGLVSQRATSDDVNPLVKNHAGVAAEGGYDPEFFIFTDDVDVDEYGALLVRMSDQEEVDTFRKPIDVAAEVLTWVRVGLYTWEEAKQWNEEPQEIED